MGEDNQCLKGYPDLVVLSELSPYMTLLIAENKLPPKLWRGDPHDSQLGQLLFYLVAHQIKAITILPYPKPVMGLFMADGHSGGKGEPSWGRVHFVFAYYRHCSDTPAARYKEAQLLSIAQLQTDHDGVERSCEMRPPSIIRMKWVYTRLTPS